jgi:hypothetical protein
MLVTSRVTHYYKWSLVNDYRRLTSPYILSFITMSSKSEASGGGGKQSARPLEVDQLLSPTLPPISETADKDNKRNVVTDKPYSVFTHREKWLIVGFASCAALFRRV